MHLHFPVIPCKSGCQIKDFSVQKQVILNKDSQDPQSYFTTGCYKRGEAHCYSNPFKLSQSSLAFIVDECSECNRKKPLAALCFSWNCRNSTQRNVFLIRKYNPSFTTMLLLNSVGVPENHEEAEHHELHPNQSSQTARSLAAPDVNTCGSFAYGNEEDDSKSD